MNPILRTGVVIVTLALLLYSVAVLTEQRKLAVSRVVLMTLTAGLCCDLTATILMIVGSRNIALTFHGCLGYSALLAMLTDTLLIWRQWHRNGGPGKVAHALHIYTRIAYGWWVLAYIAGGLLVAMGLGK